MIIDSLENLPRYESLLPGSSDVFQCIQGNLPALAPGRHQVSEGVDVIVSEEVPGERKARLEVHRRNADIQIALDGSFDIGWLPLARCQQPEGPFDSERDIQFFSDGWEVELTVVPGTFVMLFPDDAHAPCLPETAMRKAVFKVVV